METCTGLSSVAQRPQALKMTHLVGRIEPGPVEASLPADPGAAPRFGQGVHEALAGQARPEAPALAEIHATTDMAVA